PTATTFVQLTYSYVLDKDLKVIYLASFTLALDHKLPILFFNMNKPGALRRLLMGEKEETLITK
ncbi:UMP kinase, partial [Leptospira interrogans serovar Pomona]|nr:UMP kinase [Leptospira interrogans serovar Pomona]